MKKILKRDNGITLIALVITIIVLIILAAISIAVLTGEDGLITKAKQGAQNYQNAAIEEQQTLNSIYAQAGTQLAVGSTNNGGSQANQGGTTGGSGLSAQEHEMLERLYNGASIVPNPSFEPTQYAETNKEKITSEAGVFSINNTEQYTLYVITVGQSNTVRNQASRVEASSGCEVIYQTENWSDGSATSTGTQYAQNVAIVKTYELNAQVVIRSVGYGAGVRAVRIS